MQLLVTRGAGRSTQGAENNKNNEEAIEKNNIKELYIKHQPQK